MHDGGPAAVFADIHGRLLAAYVDPAHIQLRLQQIGGDFGVIGVQYVPAIDLLELEVVVVVQKLHAPGLAALAHAADPRDGGVQLLFGLGAGEPGDGDVL